MKLTGVARGFVHLFVIMGFILLVLIYVKNRIFWLPMWNTYLVFAYFLELTVGIFMAIEIALSYGFSEEGGLI
ncbi:MAG: hypothetical protein QXN26_03470 [Thermoplasmataceae archaeon]